MVVGATMVEGAEQDAVGEIGAAAARPGIAGMVSLAPGGGYLASVAGADRVSDRECLALSPGEQPA